MRRPLHVLIVEDSVVTAALLENFLNQDTRITSEIVHSLAEALCRLSQGGIHAVILDLFLDDAKDLEAVAAVRDKYPRVPIVVVTANDSYEVEGKVFSMKAQDYFSKDALQGRELITSLRHGVLRQLASEQVAEEFKPALESLVNTQKVLDEAKAIEKEWENCKT